jgi:hypothetical protein
MPLLALDQLARIEPVWIDVGLSPFPEKVEIEDASPKFGLSFVRFFAIVDIASQRTLSTREKRNGNR